MHLPALVKFSPSKIFSFFLFLVLISGSVLAIVPTSHAQGYNQYVTPNTDANVPQNQHTFVQSMMIEVLASMICQLSGTDVITQKPCLTINRETNKIGYATPSQTNQPGGLIGALTSSMGDMYAMPIHTGNYVSYMANNFGVVTSTYAQSTGFEQLDYMLRFWRIFRDIAYMGFVIAFVIIGLAIMLRVKIDPRTVMTIQNQLPKIVITMLLITFSYAIVGILVDAMWATTYLAINLFESVEDAGQIDNGKVIQNLIKSPYGFYGAITDNLKDEYSLNTPGDVAAGPVAISRRVAETFGDVAGSLTIFPNNSPCGFKIGPWQAGDDGGNIGNCAAGMFNSVLKWVVDVFVTLVVIIAIMITLFRIWFMLLRSFAYVIIYTALGPLYLFAGIFPESTFGFSPWIRGLISNLMIYPVCVAVMLAGRILMTSGNDKTLSFNPPLIGTPATGVSGLGYIIGFSFLLILPDMLTMVREALKSSPNKYIAPAILGGFQKGAAGTTMIPKWIGKKTFEKKSDGSYKYAAGQFLTGTGANAAKGTWGKVSSGIRILTGGVRRDRPSTPVQTTTGQVTARQELPSD